MSKENQVLHINSIDNPSTNLECYKLTTKAELDSLNKQLEFEWVKNDILISQINKLETQKDLKDHKLNGSYEPIEKRENNKEKSTKSKKRNCKNGKSHASQKPEKQLSDSLIETYLEEIEKLKVETKTLANEKLELENAMDDLKRQLKQNEKESQHIRAKLLVSHEEHVTIGLDNKALKALMISNEALNFDRETKELVDSNIVQIDSKADSVSSDFAIDITHVEKVVQDSDAIIFEKKPLECVRSTLKTLKSQMCELQNQAHQPSLASSMWKYKLGFTCEKCEMKWEIEHEVKDPNAKDTSTDEFLDSPISQQLPKCNCAQTHKQIEQ